MSKKLAIIKYMFLFDPVNTWQHGWQFENDLATFFAAHGFEAEILDVTGGSSERAVYITRMVTIPSIPQKSSNNPLKEANKVVNRIPDKSYKKFINPYHKSKPLPKLKFKGGK